MPELGNCTYCADTWISSPVVNDELGLVYAANSTRFKDNTFAFAADAHTGKALWYTKLQGFSNLGEMERALTLFL